MYYNLSDLISVKQIYANDSKLFSSISFSDMSFF